MPPLAAGLFIKRNLCIDPNPNIGAGDQGAKGSSQAAIQDDAVVTPCRPGGTTRQIKSPPSAALGGPGTRRVMQRSAAPPRIDPALGVRSIEASCAGWGGLNRELYGPLLEASIRKPEAGRRRREKKKKNDAGGHPPTPRR